MTTDQLKKQIEKLPAKSGIYIFKGPTLRPSSKQASRPLYIGKALNLKNRLKFYLKTDGPRFRQMISEAKKIDFIETGDDIEALILESRYIKKYRPDFNIMLRDDKQYSFVGFTKEKYPKIFITHQPLNSTEFIGPFTDGNALKTTLRLLRRIFPYCTCKQTHHNYCLNYHIEKCLGFCCLKDSPELSRGIAKREYNKNIKAIEGILSGKKSSLIKNLEKDMKILGKKQEYEEALGLQYKIEKLKRIFKNAEIINKASSFMIYHKDVGAIDFLQKLLNLRSPLRRIEAYDIADIQGKFVAGAMVVFTLQQDSGQADWQPDKNEYRKFKIQNRTTSSKIGDTKMLKEILTRRFNHSEWPMPDLILIDGGKAQLNTAISTITGTGSRTSYGSRTSLIIIALAKNKKHQGEKIYIQNKKEAIPLLKLRPKARNLLLQINSEAHRFAISYYRNLHRKSLKFKS